MYLVLDKCHERSIENEFTLLILNQIIQTIPVNYFTATLLEHVFAGYFKEALHPSKIAPLYFVGAKCYHVHTYFSNELSQLSDRERRHGEELRAHENLQRLLTRNNKKIKKNTKPFISDIATLMAIELAIMLASRGIVSSSSSLESVKSAPITTH